MEIVGNRDGSPIRLAERIGEPSQFPLYNENIRIEVRLDNETVWLTQAQMVDLFASTKQNISLHINNIFKEGELVRNSTVKECLTVQTEGNRKINRRLIYYNLDVIISVGYRVKNPIGTQFRIWANGVLKQYLLKGYAYQAQLMYVETKLDKHLQSHDEQIMELQQQVEFLVDVHKQSSGRVFPTGCVFDAWKYVSSLRKSGRFSDPPRRADWRTVPISPLSTDFPLQIYHPLQKIFPKNSFPNPIAISKKILTFAPRKTNTPPHRPQTNPKTI